MLLTVKQRFHSLLGSDSASSRFIGLHSRTSYGGICSRLVLLSAEHGRSAPATGKQKSQGDCKVSVMCRKPGWQAAEHAQAESAGCRISWPRAESMRCRPLNNGRTLACVLPNKGVCPAALPQHQSVRLF